MDLPNSEEVTVGPALPMRTGFLGSMDQTGYVNTPTDTPPKGTEFCIQTCLPQALLSSFPRLHPTLGRNRPAHDVLGTEFSICVPHSNLTKSGSLATALKSLLNMQKRALRLQREMSDKSHRVGTSRPLSLSDVLAIYL